MNRRQIYLTVTALAAATTLSACGADTAGSKPQIAPITPGTAAASAGEVPLAAASASAVPRAGTLPQGSEPVDLNPSDFTTTIDHPYWPMIPGSRWVYTETDAEGATEDVVIEVLNETKQIANGIEARVVRDSVTEGGVPRELTDDWYAQDRAGNIWYLGEYTTKYENGKVVDHLGSFEAGVDGAQPGIALPADPKPGMSYRQEYYQGVAEDGGAVITVGEEQVEVPFGHFADRILMTRDLVPTEPKVQELKFYALDVGPLLSMHTDGTFGRTVLTSFTPGMAAGGSAGK